MKQIISMILFSAVWVKTIMLDAIILNIKAKIDNCQSDPNIPLRLFIARSTIICLEAQR